MPEKYAKLAEMLSGDWPGLIMMTGAVGANPMIRQIFIAMVIVAIPSAGVTYTAVKVLENDMRQIRTEQRDSREIHQKAADERSELLRMQYRQRTEIEAIKVKIGRKGD